jgi:hypothetical protein
MPDKQMVKCNIKRCKYKNLPPEYGQCVHAQEHEAKGMDDFGGDGCFRFDPCSKHPRAKCVPVK